MDNNIKELIKKSQIKDTLEQEFRFFLDQRVQRYFELHPHGIIPNSHFASVSAECYELYRDGYFYGAISLSQAVAEALVKFICQINKCKISKNFEENLKRLKRRGFVSNTLESLFTQVWQNRDDYHHLNPTIEQDRQKLELLTKDKLSNLKSIEEDLFASSFNNGRLIPKNPKYWDQKGDKVSVFLRLD